MPAKLQPDLKNLRTMQEVWSTLDEEYGQMMENVSGLVRRLLAYKPSKEAKTDTTKFFELWRLWNEVSADLRELGKLGVLNHEPTIAAIGNMLPSHSAKDRYIELRLRRLEQDCDELKIMSEFMQAERKRQKARERMGTTEEPATKQEPGQQSRCNNCGKSGHTAAACRGAKQASKSHGTQRQDGKLSNSQPIKPSCPACNLQHTVTITAGDGTKTEFYGSRLNQCPTFKNLSIQDKTTVVENAKACLDG